MEDFCRILEILASHFGVSEHECKRLASEWPRNAYLFIGVVSGHLLHDEIRGWRVVLAPESFTLERGKPEWASIQYAANRALQTLHNERSA